jgi:hypothetical protein
MLKKKKLPKEASLPTSERLTRRPGHQSTVNLQE